MSIAIEAGYRGLLQSGCKVYAPRMEAKQCEAWREKCWCQDDSNASANQVTRADGTAVLLASPNARRS